MKLLILCLFLIGCGSTTNFYLRNDAGELVNVGRVRQNTTGSAVIETEGTSIAVDSRSPNWWEKNVLPIFGGMRDRANLTVD